MIELLYLIPIGMIVIYFSLMFYYANKLDKQRKEILRKLNEDEWGGDSK